jgi:hypothetical protein
MNLIKEQHINPGLFWSAHRDLVAPRQFPHYQGELIGFLPREWEINFILRKEPYLYKGLV